MTKGFMLNNKRTFGTTDVIENFKRDENYKFNYVYVMAFGEVKAYRVSKNIIKEIAVDKKVYDRIMLTFKGMDVPTYGVKEIADRDIKFQEYDGNGEAKFHKIKTFDKFIEKGLELGYKIVDNEFRTKDNKTFAFIDFENKSIKINDWAGSRGNLNFFHIQGIFDGKYRDFSW